MKTKTSRKKEYGVNKILREKIVLTINLKIIFKYTIYYFNNIISNNTLFFITLTLCSNKVVGRAFMTPFLLNQNSQFL